MAKTHPPYAPEFRRQMVELVRSGRSGAEPGRLSLLGARIASESHPAASCRP